jgi:hypothetical protein
MGPGHVAATGSPGSPVPSVEVRVVARVPGFAEPWVLRSQSGRIPAVAARRSCQRS